VNGPLRQKTSPRVQSEQKRSLLICPHGDGKKSARDKSPNCLKTQLQLLKIGAPVTISVRRVKLAFATASPARHEFEAASRHLRV
jgi:hypothetical protein